MVKENSDCHCRTKTNTHRPFSWGGHCWQHVLENKTLVIQPTPLLVFSPTFRYPQRWSLLAPLQGPTRKPRHASVCNTHSDTQAVPAFDCIRMFKGIFRHASVFKTHRHAVYQCLKEVQKLFRHASVFKTRISTLACPFLKRAFSRWSLLAP